MQANLEDETDLTFNPAVRPGFAAHAEAIEAEINDNSDVNKEHDEDEENEEDEDDFTFASAVDEDISSSTAEEIFHKGKIRPVFPLFDQSLVDHQALIGFPHQPPPVKNVFVGACSSQGGGDEDEAAGPYCAWSKKEAAVESDPAAATVCKKSNSTGFSKLWRFKEMSSRSNSDGRDTFVFLNKHSQAPEKKASESVAVASSTSAKTTATKTKGGGKGKTSVSSSSVSAHELYTKSKTASREEDRRKSYLPYKPELVGFFTNVNGGMSKNVHPF